MIKIYFYIAKIPLKYFRNSANIQYLYFVIVTLNVVLTRKLIRKNYN